MSLTVLLCLIIVAILIYLDIILICMIVINKLKSDENLLSSRKKESFIDTLLELTQNKRKASRESGTVSHARKKTVDASGYFDLKQSIQ